MKKIFVGSFLIVGYFFNAQSIGNSPYASYGIGDVKYDNTVETNSMGGLSTAYISDFPNSFNFKNPAANDNLELTSFRIEARNENNFFKSGVTDSKSTKHSTYLSNISLAFPLSPKVKFGLGYQPYSSKSYNVVQTELFSDGTIKANNFEGTGSVNTLQAAVSYKITPELSLGLRTNYYFGNISDIDEVTTSNSELINGYETNTKIQNLNFTAGTTYQKKFDNDHKLTFGATSTFGNSSKLTTKYTNSTYYYDGLSVKVQEDIIEEKEGDVKSLFPLEISTGAGYGHLNKWFVGTQVDYKKGQTVDLFGQVFEYRDSYKFIAGGWFLPNANDFRNYFNRVIYRYGAYYEKGNLFINDTNINTVGLSFGATLPFKNTGANRLSGLDIGVDLGKRGTTKNNLINQNFVNLKIGINFSDKWFNKRLIN
ncbi:hypothetical protein [Frigoriflavimonas asaccharolytica]|uniref:Long-subunit fatty acid transport protein n=1 Tax=Frigoriflavimonas asaccharolytica TaxID=2735899 RepID=A0A8J8G9C8_9FLAO|nr:hypothetical protein [Frigoriflavimonas asaccharolytica]NRS93291.1 hypothetical protein [Frigoriflavimonas asaccharolytica]